MYGVFFCRLSLCFRCWRRFRAKSDFESLLVDPRRNSVNVHAIQRFAHLLERRHDDETQEGALQELRAEVARAIRAIYELRRDIRSLEAKLGMVEEGRLSMSEVDAFFRVAAKRRQNNLAQPVLISYNG